MSDAPGAPDSLSGPLVVMRIITFSMILGVAAFLGVVWMQGLLAQPPNGQAVSILSAIAAGVILILQLLVPLFIQSPSEFPDSADADSQAIGLYTIRHIVRMALLEGAAMLNVVALMQEHNQWSLGVIAVLMAALLLHWPTRRKLEEFVENRRLEATLRTPE